jgi:hypothetical protein
MSQIYNQEEQSKIRDLQQNEKKRLFGAALAENYQHQKKVS